MTYLFFLQDFLLMLPFLKRASQHLLREKNLLQPIAIPPLIHRPMLPSLRNPLLPGLVPSMQNQFSVPMSQRVHVEVQRGQHHMEVRLKNTQRVISEKALMEMLKPTGLIFLQYSVTLHSLLNNQTIL